MKTKEIAPKKKTNKVRVLTAKEKIARKEAFQASEYNQTVNVVHRATKQHTKTLSGSRALLLNAQDEANTALTPNFIKILKASKKSKAVYKHMEANVRAYNSGSYGTHTVLQYLRKFENDLLDLVKSGV